LTERAGEYRKISNKQAVLVLRSISCGENISRGEEFPVRFFSLISTLALAGDGCWWFSNIRLSLSLSISNVYRFLFILMVLDGTFMILYSIAHHGAGRVLTASRPSRQKVDGIIVEDSGTFGALDVVRAI
jgi:hypothetical protein